MRTAIDNMGVAITLLDSAQRVVSLVRSLTESVALTRRESLIAATNWRTHPDDRDISRISGRKNPDVAAIIARELAVGLLLAANASTWILKTQLPSRPDLGLSEITPATHNNLLSRHTSAVFSVVVLIVVVPHVDATWSQPPEAHVLW